MRYEDLDPRTRIWMLEEFRWEEARGPYRSPSLSREGKSAFPRLMEAAISNGSEESLALSLGMPEMWAEFEPSPAGGVRRTDPTHASKLLARNEFNTWYVRGLCRRLIEEGEEYCQVYRAEDGETEGDECDAYENKVFEIRFVYNGHRAKYWPYPNPHAFSVPSVSGCKHTVRRIPADMRAMFTLEQHSFGAAFRRS